MLIGKFWEAFFINCILLCHKPLNRVILKNLILILSFAPIIAFSQQTNEAFEFYAKYTGEYAFINNLEYKHLSAYLGNIDMIVNFNTEKAKLWKGGKFSVYILNDHGEQPSAKYIGELQLFSNIEAPERTKLYELWYEQTFIKNFSLKIGQQNINSEFAYSDCALNFINTSFGIMPSISFNIPISIFPNTALGARLHWTINDKWMIQGAVMSGNPGNETNNKYGINYEFHRSDGINVLGEAHYTLKVEDHQTGKYKLGFWYHSAKFVAMGDSTKEFKGNFGIYILADQMIYSEQDDSKQGLSMFIMSGISAKDQNLVHYSYDGGLCYTGLIKGRNDDVLGIGFTNATFNRELVKEKGIENSENALELVYLTKINEHFTLQPDFQYFINPGGVKNNSTFIALLRIGICF
jgi:porin